MINVERMKVERMKVEQIKVERIKELKIMKALRYLLIVMMLSAASVLFAAAQSLAQQPKAEMQSTSVMVSSGSALPSAAASGTVLTGSKLGTYAPADATSGPQKMRRDVGGGGGTADDDDPDGPADPYPVGDAALPLMLLALAYAIYRVRRRIRA